MLEDLYPIAVESGIPVDKFWELTYGELMVQLEANRNREMRKLQMQAMMDYKQAQLNMYTNAPNEMPKIHEHYPFVEQPEEPKSVEGLEGWQLMKQQIEARAKQISNK
ncbi:hypothetical protein EQG49_02290 [Periweissella cryptocerci]|uniref:Uncharacterized protein n=1 Tax=Periweissella cryptocerci TaxID=2506420 RepID=A0A4P6YRW5_9LACO|nr:hypothetical protein [Periweissella cryptocerci]QBO35376.1 hypothetical protein EQG49_02290 [Periweissella cryptocerci]